MKIPRHTAADLRRGICTIRALLDGLPALDRTEVDFAGQVLRYHESVQMLGRRLPSELPELRIDSRSDALHVACFGLRASSTGGLPEALRNWIKAADPELARREKEEAQ